MDFVQTKYIDQYNKEKYKMYQFRVKKSDEKLIHYLDNLNNRNNYIISLIENDTNRNIYTIKELKNIIIPIMHKYSINDIYLFGSYARGEAHKDSDVDIYCDKGNIKDLIDQGRLEEELEKALGKSVDVIFDTSIMDDFFRKQIMEDLIKLC